MQICGALPPGDNAKAKALLDRIVAMLTKLGHRGYVVNEESVQYNVDLIDSDTDSDPDESKENTDTQSVDRTKKCV